MGFSRWSAVFMLSDLWGITGVWLTYLVTKGLIMFVLLDTVQQKKLGSYVLNELSRVILLLITRLLFSITLSYSPLPNNH